MNDRRLIILIIFVTLSIIAVAVFLTSSQPSSQALSINPSSNAIAYVLDSTSFDWGDIDFDDEIATKEFNIKNKGTDILKLYNIKTSCHCTKAKIVLAEEESPYFGMSGVSSWLGELKPGQEAKLIVKFDQRFHGPQGIGPITRYVSVETNDKANPKLTFTLMGTVVKK